MRPGMIRYRGYVVEELIGGLSFPAINALGNVHGGAGEQAVTLYMAIDVSIQSGTALGDAVAAEIDARAASGEHYVPGFGHRFHPVDPRAPRLLEIVDAAASAGTVSGRFATIGRAVEVAIADRKGKPDPMNIDGATAIIYAELGFALTLCRGLFVLSRSVGALAHAWEQSQQGGRNKGPIPRGYLWQFFGKPSRPMG